MVRTLPAARIRVPATGRAREPDVVRRQLLPIRLMEVLAHVRGVGVIQRMPVTRGTPVIARPQHADPGGVRAGGPAAKARKEIHGRRAPISGSRGQR